MNRAGTLQVRLLLGYSHPRRAGRTTAIVHGVDFAQDLGAALVCSFHAHGIGAKAADLSQLEKVMMSTKWYYREQERSVLEYLKTGTNLRKVVFDQSDVTHRLRW